MFTNIRLLILYGSETGNAQDLAERIWRESKRYYFQSTVMPMDDYSILNLIHEHCVIFICSTTGQGDVPANMRTFWKFMLRKNLPLDSLRNTNFAVFGLGDSSYVKYNFTAKRLHKRLQQLNANSLVPLGLGDDQHDLGYDATADPWIKNLWEALLKRFPLPDTVRPLTDIFNLTPKFRVITNTLSVKTQNDVNSDHLYNLNANNGEFKATILKNNRLTHPSHFQDVRLITLQTNGEEYSPGDVLVLRPQNSANQIEAFKNLLKEHNLNFDKSMSLESSSSDTILPPVLRKTINFNALCSEYFDLSAIPRRRVFEILGHLTDSELEREKCAEFNSAEGQDDLYTYCNRPKRNIVEVLGDFPHATKNLTLEFLFEIMQPIKAREFSIASSFKVSENRVDVLIAVVRYKTKLVKERLGLCSNYLADLKINDTVTAWIKKGSFRFPLNIDCPVIMVGPGTGLAAFRSFALERSTIEGSTADNLVLFFGCRHPDMDFHCADDLETLQNNHKLNLITAFSRNQQHKIYVQDRILENKDLVWDVLERNGHIYVAGNSKLMPQQVRQAFVNVCSICGNMSEENAEKYISKMEKENRYQTECWS